MPGGPGELLPKGNGAYAIVTLRKDGVCLMDTKRTSDIPSV